MLHCHTFVTYSTVVTLPQAIQYTHHDNSTAIFHILYTDCVICNSKTKSILYLLNSIFFIQTTKKAAPNKKKIIASIYSITSIYIYFIIAIVNGSCIT